MRINPGSVQIKTTHTHEKSTQRTHRKIITHKTNHNPKLQKDRKTYEEEEQERKKERKKKRKTKRKKKRKTEKRQSRETYGEGRAKQREEMEASCKGRAEMS